MENIIEKLAVARSKKGYSYENVAKELDLSTSAYRKIETGETKLTVERLKQLAEVLETPIEDFLEIDAQKNFNQEIKEQSTGNQGFNNDNRVYNENSELSKKLIAMYEDQIKDLKNQVEYWKSKAPL